MRLCEIFSVRDARRTKVFPTAHFQNFFEQLKRFNFHIVNTAVCASYCRDFRETVQR